MRIAALQTAGHPGDVDANLGLLRSSAASAVAGGAQLLIVPELFVTGYDIGPVLFELASGHDFTALLSDIARESGIALVAGIPEQDGEKLYNSCCFIGPDGRLLDLYRKAHLFGELDREYFTAGDAPFGLVEFGGVRIATMICYDVEFPESVRAAALAGADLIAVPTAQMEPFSFLAEQLVRVRAWENQVYVAYCNHIGTERSTVYVGRSSIVGPSAEVLAAAGPDEPALLFADVDPDVVRAAQAANPYLTDRRDFGPPAPAALP